MAYLDENGLARLWAQIILRIEEQGTGNTGSIDSSISTHNSSPTSHEDIRTLITNLSTRINTILNSTDEDLDQLSEIVTYIQSNKSLIDAITTAKIGYSDIIDNLTSSDNQKPLSANQGRVLNEKISSVTTNLVNGSGTSAIKGINTIDASGPYSFAEGYETQAYSKSLHVEGEYNILEKTVAERGNYIHIAGNGTSDSERSNAYTLDWDGNGWFAGNLEADGGELDVGSKDFSSNLALMRFNSTDLTNSQVETVLMNNIIEPGFYITMSIQKEGEDVPTVFTPIDITEEGVKLETALSIESGGTGASTAAEALQNLGITYGTEDLEAGVSSLETGKVYLVYE